MIEVSDKDLNPAELLSRLSMEGAGSVVIHLGVCKADPDGGKSEGVSFTRVGDAEAELAAIESELRSRFQISDAVLVKRTGTVEVGQYILFVAMAAKDRDNSFGACQAAVDMCKKLKTLKKKELFVE